MTGRISAYLSKPRRALPVACRDVYRGRGRAAPPCGPCSLKALCRTSLGDAPETRSDRAPDQDPRTDPEPQA